MPPHEIYAKLGGMSMKTNLKIYVVCSLSTGGCRLIFTKAVSIKLQKQPWHYQRKLFLFRPIYHFSQSILVMLLFKHTHKRSVHERCMCMTFTVTMFTPMFTASLPPIRAELHTSIPTFSVKDRPAEIIIDRHTSRRRPCFAKYSLGRYGGGYSSTPTLQPLRERRQRLPIPTLWNNNHEN